MSKISNRVPITTRGDLVRGDAGGALGRLAAVTDNRVVAGDGTDVVLKQIDDPAFFSTGAEGTATAHGVFKKNRWQQKILGSDVTTNGDIASLEFTLEIGVTYRITYQARLQTDGTDTSAAIEIRDGTTPLARAIWTNDVASNGIGSFGGSVIRTMTDTSLSFVGSSLSANGKVLGDGTGISTWALVEELNDIVLTAAW